jgi:hypothetical protein
MAENIYEELIPKSLEYYLGVLGGFDGMDELGEIAEANE